MVTIDHAFKVACRGFSDGAKIDMYTHDDADCKAGTNMQQFVQIKSDEAKETVHSNFRVKQSPA